MDRASMISVLEDTKRSSDKCLTFLTEYDSSYYTFKERSEALDMAIAALREQEQSKWISDRLPTEDECNRAIVGVVNGYNGRITFTDAEIFVCYDFKEKDWYSEDYDIEGCKVRCWMPLPEPPKEGADHA